MAQDEQEPKHSAAKAAVAQQKPRDASGRFLSGAELEQYRAQQQQAQQSAERARLEQLFGRQVSPPATSGMPNMPMQSSDNFAAIINANKPGGMASNLSEEDKWAVLLGKKRRGGGLL